MSRLLCSTVLSTTLALGFELPVLDRASAVDLVVDTTNNNTPFTATSATYGVVVVGQLGPGELIVNNAGVTVSANGGGFDFRVGNQAGSSGLLTFSAGAINATSAGIGTNGAGTANQSGGTLTAGVVSIAAGSGSNGTYNLSGGSIVTTGAGFGVGAAGDGTLNVSGTGSVSVGVSGLIRMGGSNASGTINLDGGSISTKGILSNSSGSGATLFNFNGGTLQAAADNANFLSGLSQAQIRNGAAVIDTNGFAVTIGQALLHSTIGGDAAIDGGLTKIGTGTLTLSGANTYSGGTTISAGTVTVGNNAAFGTGTVTMAQGTTMAFAAGTNYTIANNLVINGDPIFDTPTGTTQTISGVISDGGTPGVVEKNGAGTLVFTGANTYSGGTIINAGTLSIASNAGNTDHGTLGTGAVVNNATLNFAFTDAPTGVTVANAISGTGAVTFGGTSPITMTGALTYTGGTTLSSVAVVLGDATRSVTLPGNATLNGTAGLAIDNGSLGSGTIQVNSGTSVAIGTLLGASATAGSATIVNQGTVTFQNSGSGGTAQIANTGIVDFANASTAANTVITTSASALLQFRDSATAGNATLVLTTGANGTFGLGSTAGNATITVADTASLVFQGNASAGAATVTTSAGAALDGTGTMFTDNANGGTSRQVVNAGGLLDISQATGGVTVGSLEGAGGVVALGGKTLTIGANGLSTAFSGVIQNLGNLPGSGSLAGGLTKIGAGTLTLTGTLPTTVINGTLSPGNSIGTITVAGNLTFAGSGTYKVEVSPSAADRVNVTGAATLAGTVSALFQPGTYITRNYVILSAAGGLAGTSFAALTTTNLPAGFLAKLSYTATDVVLDLTATIGTVQGLNRNQQAVATSLGNAFNAGAALPPGFTGVFGLTGAPLGAALSQLSGEPATGAIQAGLQSTGAFLGLMLDPFVATRGGAGGVAGAGGPALAFAGDGVAANPAGALSADAARAYAAAMPGVYGKAPPAALPSPQWTVWGAAFGGNGRVDGDAVAGSHDLDTRVFGVAAGADYRVSPDAVLGFALAGGGTRWTTAGLGDGKTDTAQAGLYGSQKFGPAFVSAALAYAWHDATTTRMVSVAGETLEGRFRPQVFGARVEAGWRLGGPALGLTPYAAGQVQAVRLPGFAETATAGAGSFALSYAGETVTAPRSELGAWTDARLPTGLGELILRGRAAWAHDYETDRRLTPTFQALPTASFVVGGAAPAADLALLSAAAELRLATGVTVIGKADGELGAGTRALAGTGTLLVTW